MKSHFDFLPALSVSNLSQKWGIDPQTIRKLIKDGKLTAMKLQGKDVVLGEDWKSFEDKCKTQNLSKGQTHQTGTSDITTKTDSVNSFRQELRIKNSL